MYLCNYINLNSDFSLQGDQGPAGPSGPRGPPGLGIVGPKVSRDDQCRAVAIKQVKVLHLKCTSVKTQKCYQGKTSKGPKLTVLSIYHL